MTPEAELVLRLVAGIVANSTRDASIFEDRRRLRTALTAWDIQRELDEAYAAHQETLQAIKPSPGSGVAGQAPDAALDALKAAAVAMDRLGG